MQLFEAKPSFAFLDMDEVGVRNPIAIGLEAVLRAFLCTFFAEKKSMERDEETFV